MITSESEEELNKKMYEWQNTLKRRGLKINSKKTEVMVSGKRREDVNVTDTKGDDIMQVEGFCYLGSLLEESGGCSKEVQLRISKAWRKWREVSGVVCDKRMTIPLKRKIYTSVIRPVLLYGLETAALRKEEERALARTEMRMLRWICRISLREHRTNDDIRKFIKVSPVSEKVKEARLRWLGHVIRRKEADPIKKAFAEKVTGKRSRGRQRIRWSDIVERDMKKIGAKIEDCQDRVKWKRLSRAADPT